MKEHITIIGAGNLTMSILGAIKRSGAKFTINVVDIDKKKSSQLKKFGGNVSKTAKFVGMERSALHRKLKDLGVKDLN